MPTVTSDGEAAACSLSSAARAVRRPASGTASAAASPKPVQVPTRNKRRRDIAFIATTGLLAWSRIGKAARATEYDELGAQLIGIPTERVVRLMFAMSGVLAGVAGVVTALLYSNVAYDMGDSYLLKGFVIIVLGGFGSVGGTALASLIVAGIDIGSVAVGLSGYADAIAFGLLILILMLRPGGLVAAKASTRP